MKYRLAMTFGLALAAAPVLALAQDDAPNLEGVWKAADGVVINADGRVSQIPADFDILEYEIHSQAGPVFQVNHRAKHKSPGGPASHGGAPFEGQDHPALGVVDGTGPLVVLADVGDTTTYECNLIDEDSMRCVFSEPGDAAIAGFMLLQRQK